MWKVETRNMRMWKDEATNAKLINTIKPNYGESLGNGPEPPCDVEKG